jgi:MoaA/NifB/PqqE/SkfB family radical SAM enzyme
MKKDIFLELVITNKCNIRCSFCSVELGNNSMSSETLENLHGYLRKNRNKFRNIVIDFFGGEPTLEYLKIKKFIKKTKDLNIRYVIGTNAILIDDEKVDFFKKNNVEIIVSISSHNSRELMEKIEKYPMVFSVNLVIVPSDIFGFFEIVNKLQKLPMKSLNVLPVFGTMTWHKTHLDNLSKLVATIKKYNLRNVSSLKYFHERTKERECLIDWNGNAYFDKDPCLFTYEETCEFLKDKVSIGNLNSDDFNLDKIFEEDGVTSINKDKKAIAEKLGFSDEVVEINKILDSLV